MSSNLNSSNSSLDENIGGFPYILNTIGIYMPYSVISAIGCIVGVVGNTIIITAVLIKSELRTNPTCILITNLAISDFMISFVVNSSTVFGVFLGREFFDSHKALCVFIGASCLVACGTSLVTMGILAINRYVCILHYNKYNGLFSFKKTLIYSVIAWILASLINMPNFIDGVGGYVYDTKALSCLFDRLKVNYTIGFSVGCIIIPCMLIGYLYMHIFLHAFMIRSKINQSNVNANHNRRKLEAIRLAKTLFASFFIFSACWIPVSIIFIVGRDDGLPIPAHTFTNLPAHLNSAINPIFYGIYNPKIRQGYVNLFNIITCKTKSSQISNYQNSTKNTIEDKSVKIINSL